MTAARELRSVDHRDGTPLTATVPTWREGAGLVIRRARRYWPCQARPGLTGFDTQNRPYTTPGERSPLCLGTIEPGTLYLEYLGESAAYESGKRYCRHCAVHAWADYLTITRGETPPPRPPAEQAALDRLAGELTRALKGGAR